MILFIVLNFCYFLCSSPVHSQWEALVASGSDILYTWEVNGTAVPERESLVSTYHTKIV